MTHYTGTLIIDGVDFWIWVSEYFGTKINIEEINGVNFTDIDVELNYKDKIHRIPIEDFWSWIHEQMPNPAHESLMNKPVYKNQTIIIEFAAGTDSPEMWDDSIKPSWLK